MYIKSHYKKEPVFANSKIVFSVTKNTIKEKLGESFAKQIIASSPLKEKDVELYKDGDNTDMFIGGAKFADAAILGDSAIDEKIIAAVKPSRNKKVLNFNPESDDVTDIMELYSNLAGK